MNKKQPLIELCNISKSFNENNSQTIIFENLNLSINYNETISVCGASGSGKTTLLNIVTLLDQPNRGDVIWNNKNTKILSLDEISMIRNKMFGYIFQGCNLIPELTAIENILFPLRIFGKITHSNLEFAHSLLGNVGLFDRRNDKINQMSGGEKQRLAIVRAMISEPKLLIADEPTGNLDTKNSEIVMQIIIDLCKTHSSSLLLITHNEKIANSMQVRYNIEQLNLILAKSATA